MSWWFTFYLALALGFLAKGPVAWLPLVTVAVTIIFARDAQLARRFKVSYGILLTLALVAFWGIPALIQTRGEFFTVGIGRHVIGRSFATMEGHGANSLGMYLLLLPFYFVTVFVSFFPWSIKLPWLVRTLWRERKTGIADPGYSWNLIDNYLLWGIAIIFIIFTLIKTKLPHYTLPAFPLLSLLLARHLIGREKFLKLATAAAICVYLAIAALVPLIVSGALVVLPPLTGSFPAHDLFEASRSHLRPDMEFGAVDFQEPSLIWYFRSRVRGWMTPLNKRTAAEFMNKGGPRFVILPTARVAKILPNLLADWKTFSTDGFNIAKGKRVDLTLVLKPE